MPEEWWISVQRQMAAGETDQRIYCVDCGALTVSLGDWYMLEDRVWKETGLAPDGGVLCLPCCECRLGRELEEFDFAIADEGDAMAGFWLGRRMLPKRWNVYVAMRKGGAP